MGVNCLLTDCMCEKEKLWGSYRNLPISKPGSEAQSVQEILVTYVPGYNSTGAGESRGHRISAEFSSRPAVQSDVIRYSSLRSRDGTEETAVGKLQGTCKSDHSRRNSTAGKSWQNKSVKWRSILFLLLLVSSVFGEKFNSNWKENVHLTHSSDYSVPWSMRSDGWQSEVFFPKIRIQKDSRICYKMSGSAWQGFHPTRESMRFQGLRMYNTWNPTSY